MLIFELSGVGGAVPLNLICMFVGCMSQREGVIRFYKKHNKTFFNIIKFWVQKSGTIGQLIYSVRLPHGASSWEKFVAACMDALPEYVYIKEI